MEGGYGVAGGGRSGNAAASGDGPPRWPGRSAWRRSQRRTAMVALRCRLDFVTAQLQQALLGGVLEPPGVDQPAWSDELRHRMGLIAPAVVAGLQRVPVDSMTRRRRNAASHCFDAPAAFIGTATGAQLNRLQRLGSAGLGADAVGGFGADLGDCFGVANLGARRHGPPSGARAWPGRLILSAAGPVGHGWSSRRSSVADPALVAPLALSSRASGTRA